MDLIVLGLAGLLTWLGIYIGYICMREIGGKSAVVKTWQLLLLITGLAVIRLVIVFTAEYFGVPPFFMPTILMSIFLANSYLLARVLMGHRSNFALHLSLVAGIFALGLEYVAVLPITLYFNTNMGDTMFPITPLWEWLFLFLAIVGSFFIIRIPAIRRCLTITLDSVNYISLIIAIFTFVSMMLISGIIVSIVGHYLGPLLDTSIILVAVALVIFSLFLQYHIRKSHMAIRDKTLITSQHAMDQQYIAHILSHHQKVKTMEHDFKHHLSNLHTLAEKGHLPQLLESIKTLGGQPTLSIFDTGNPMLDALLSTKYQEAKAHHIHITIHLDISQNCPTFTLEACAMVSNALDNAIEAATPAPIKTIELEITTGENQILLRMRNTYLTPPTKIGNRLKTHKPNPSKHGLGLSSMEDTCHRMGGQMAYHWDDEYFMVHMSIPIKNQYYGGTT